MKSITKAIYVVIILMATFSYSFAQNKTDSSSITGKLSINEFENKIKTTQNAQLVDVRTPDEFVTGHLKDAKNIDFWAKDFDKQIMTLDKSKPTFVYCLAGTRSIKARDFMKINGFKEVYYMDGGIMKWRLNDKPLVEQALPIASKGMNEVEFKNAVKKDKLVLVDFFAVWCPPCKSMNPVIEQISDELKDRVEVLKINFDENKYLAKYLKIENFPTFIIYKNGEQVWRGEGAMEKSALKLIISKY